MSGQVLCSNKQIKPLASDIIRGWFDYIHNSFGTKLHTVIMLWHSLYLKDSSLILDINTRRLNTILSDVPDEVLVTVRSWTHLCVRPHLDTVVSKLMQTCQVDRQLCCVLDIGN